MKDMLNTPTKKIVAVAVAILLIAGILVLATSRAGAANTTRGIGLEKSIAVALADAGLKEDQVSNLQGHFDTDDGIEAYDVSFNANGYEYDYSIKAADGAILECNIESPDGERVTADEARDIGQEKALTAALTHAGLKKADVEITRSSKDLDEEGILYEFDFTKDNVKYEYDIDGITGNVREFSREVIDKQSDTSADGNSSQAGGTATDGSGKTDTSIADGSGTDNSGTDNSAAANSNYIGVDKAKKIALDNAGVQASAATFSKAKLDRDNGVYEYDIEFYANGYEYEYEIDATTGKILEHDSEPLDEGVWNEIHDDDDDDDEEDDD